MPMKNLHLITAGKASKKVGFSFTFCQCPIPGGLLPARKGQNAISTKEEIWTYSVLLNLAHSATSLSTAGLLYSVCNKQKVWINPGHRFLL
jgi:hypothetical protein